MPEPEASANDQEPRASQPSAPWHDKVLVDAIGYTKGLVAILDSLSEGFQRRGRELDEQRARLAILQSERRTILQERSDFDARITALTAEREAIRTTLEARERDLNELQQGAAQTQAALQAQTRESEALRSDFDARITALTAERDELQTALRARERELDEQRARLTRLDNERRTILQERSEFDTRVTTLTAECNRLQVVLEARDRELDEQRARLAILQSEHRASLQERSQFDARITALTAERDELQTALRARERELGKLSQSTEQAQTALEAQRREIQTLQAGMAETTRQADELRAVVRSLERQLQRAAQTPARAPVTPVPREPAAPGGGRGMPQLDVAEFEALFSDQRGAEQHRIAELTAERDGLRGTLTEREQEIDRLRQEAARGQAALEAQTREMHALRTGMAETVRQAEEIRKVLQALEGEIESAARREAVLEEALEAERRKVREAVVRAGQEQRALREDLTDAEGLLAEARKDIGASQGVIASLRGTVDEERSRGGALREQLEKRSAELAQLHATLQAAPTLLTELLRVFSGSEEAAHEPSHAEGQEAGRLEAPAQAPAVGHPAADALTILRTVRDALRDVCTPPLGPEAQRAELAMDPAGLRRRAEQIADDWRRVVRTRSESARPEEPARQERGPLPEQVGPRGEARNVPPERETPPLAPPEPSSAPAGPASPSPKRLKRPGPPSGMTVECTFPASGTETACILRGEIARINDMGLLASFEERLPEGAPMVVRFVRGGEMVACLARVVRVQELAGTSASHATLHHLIRFESAVSAAGEKIRPPIS